MAKVRGDPVETLNKDHPLHLTFQYTLAIFLVLILMFAVTYTLISLSMNFEREFMNYVILYFLIPIATLFATFFNTYGGHIRLNISKYVKGSQQGIQGTPVCPSSSSPRDDYNNAKKKAFNNYPKIDPKYFKPKYLIHELMSIWSTTYTVITWGSAWMIGGTIVATERFATKMKTKYTREHHHPERHNSSTSTGYSDTTSMDSTQSFNDTTNQESRNSITSRFLTRTKKYITSAKKKLNRFRVSGSMPQLTDSTPATHQRDEDGNQSFWSRW